MFMVDSAIKSPIWVRISIFVLLLLLHLAFVYRYCTFDYLASFGGLMTVVGFVFIFGHSLPEAEPVKASSPVTKSAGVYMVDVGSVFSEIVSEEAAKEIQEDYENKLEIHKEYLDSKRKHLFPSFYFTVVGTLLWSYAGYLNFVFN